MIFDPHIYILEQNFLSSYTDWIHTQIFHASNNSNILNIYLKQYYILKEAKEAKEKYPDFFLCLYFTIIVHGEFI